MDEDEQYRDLINKLSMKRAAERALLTFIAVCVVGILALLLFQNRELDTQVRNQQAAAVSRQRFFNTTTQQLKDQNAQIKDQTSQIEDYLQCLGEFFAQPNRQNLTITDLQQCKLNANAFSPTAAIVPKLTTAPTAKTPTTSEPPKSPGPSSGGTSSPGGDGSGSGQPSSLEKAAQSVVSLPSRIIKAMSGLL